MIPPIPPPDAPGAPAVQLQEKGRPDHGQGRQPGGDIVRPVVQLGGGPAEMQISVVLVAHHGIHGVDGLIEEAARRAEEGHPEEGGHHPVGGVLRHGLYGGLDHLLLGQFFRVPAHQHADLAAAGGKALGFETGHHLLRLRHEAPGGEALPAEEGAHSEVGPGMDPPSKIQQQKARAGADQGHRKGHDPARGPLPLGGLREAGPKPFFEKGDELTHEHHGMGGAQGVPQQAVQPEAREDGQGGEAVEAHPAPPPVQRSESRLTGRIFPRTAASSRSWRLF